MALATFTPSGTVVTTTGTSGVIDTGAASIQLLGSFYSPQYVSVLIQASAVGGTSPSLTAELQWSNDGVNFASVQGTTDNFTAITANGNTVKNFLAKARFCRLNYTVSGTTPTFTLNSTAYIS